MISIASWTGAEQADGQQNICAAVLEGYLEVLIRYRGSILALMRDVSATAPRLLRAYGPFLGGAPMSSSQGQTQV